MRLSSRTRSRQALRWKPRTSVRGERSEKRDLLLRPMPSLAFSQPSSRTRSRQALRWKPRTSVRGERSEKRDMLLSSSVIPCPSRSGELARHAPEAQAFQGLRGWKPLIFSQGSGAFRRREAKHRERNWLQPWFSRSCHPEPARARLSGGSRTSVRGERGEKRDLLLSCKVIPCPSRSGELARHAPEAQAFQGLSL